MEFRSLRYFVAVVNAGSFNRAADELHISQPTLSKAVTALEEEVGVTLIERGRRGVTLSWAAQAWLHIVKTHFL